MAWFFGVLSIVLAGASFLSIRALFRLAGRKLNFRDQTKHSVGLTTDEIKEDAVTMVCRFTPYVIVALLVIFTRYLPESLANGSPVILVIIALAIVVVAIVWGLIQSRPGEIEELDESIGEENGNAEASA